MSDIDALARLDAVAQAELVRTGELSAVDLVDACAARAAKAEPWLHAFTVTDFEAARVRAAGPLAGPLAGVPLAVKDLVPVPGLRMSLGSRLFARNVAAPSRAPANTARSTRSSASNGAIVITPRTRRDGIAANRSASAGSCAGAYPPLESSPETFTCTSTSSTCPTFAATSRAASTNPSRSSAWNRENRGNAFALFVCRCPMRCQRTPPRVHAASTSASIFAVASCTLFSPTSVIPAAHAASTASGPWVLVTAIKRTSCP